MRNIYIIMSREKNKKPTNSLDQLETHSVFFIELYPVCVGFFICGVSNLCYSRIRFAKNY